MNKAFALAFASLCAVTVSLDALWRVVENLNFVQLSFGSGALLAVCAAAPFVMKPSDTDINDVGLASFEDDEPAASPLLSTPKGVVGVREAA